MKTLNIYKLIILVFAAMVAISCVKDDDYDVPNLVVTPPTLEGEQITISALKQLLLQAQPDPNEITEVLTIEDNIYTTGFVISSDEFGNFYKELILQDNSANPTTGVKILVDVNPVFIHYEFGRKTHIQLQGLTVDINSGVLTLGVRNGNAIDEIAAPLMGEIIKKDVEVEEIVPLPMNISDFNADKTNLFIRLTDAQFNRNDVLGENPKSFAGEEDDEFDGERVLETCNPIASTVFSTSTFADFKAVAMPSGRGTLDGILTYNYFGDTFNVVVNSPLDIHFDSTDRCDPQEVDCGLATSTGSNVIFSEYFETQEEGESVTGNGWTNYIQEGTRDYQAYFNDGANSSLGISASIGSFNSNDDSTIAWLIMPEINFDAQDGETINFKTSNSFADGSNFELVFSSNWDGNPANIATSTWAIIPAAYIVQDDDDYAVWFSSGNVSLDCITGSGYIGFKYTGSGEEDFDGTYELDEIVVNSN